MTCGINGNLNIFFPSVSQKETKDTVDTQTHEWRIIDKQKLNVKTDQHILNLYVHHWDMTLFVFYVMSIQVTSVIERFSYYPARYYAPKRFIGMFLQISDYEHICWTLDTLSHQP